MSTNRSATALVTGMSAEFYDTIAPEYDVMLGGLPGDRWVRDAFLDLVRKTVKPGSSLLDFGCGTGTDAAWYARNGYQVTAYDHSPEMTNQLRKKCSDEVSRGTIVPLSGGWDSFLGDIKKHPPHDAVVSDFAVLNEIADLEPIFSAFADCLSPDGAVILSLLNPFCRRSTGLLRKWKHFGMHDRERNGEPGKPRIDPYLHSAGEIETAAGGWFMLAARASAGIFVDYEKGEYTWDRPLGFSSRLERRVWLMSPFSSFGKFFFLVFRKR